MRDQPIDDALSRLLRAGDPAAEEPNLEPRLRAAIRRRVLAAGREHERRPNGWLVPAATVVALLALALGLAWRAPQNAPLTTADLPASATAAAAAEDTGQQVQFTTESGTLVVWVLMPRSAS